MPRPLPAVLRRRLRRPAPSPSGALVALLVLALMPQAVALARNLARPTGGSAPATAAAAVQGPGRVQVMSLRDPSSGRRHQVLVYRPAVADSSTLPVLYFLHGVPGQARDVFNAGLARRSIGTSPRVMLRSWWSRPTATALARTPSGWTRPMGAIVWRASSRRS